MPRKEKNFQREIYQSLRTLDGPCFYHKIVDAGFRNPFDAVLCYDTRFIAMEYKISKLKTCINLKSLFRNRQHELSALNRVADSGGESYILINVFEPRKRNEIIVLKIGDYEWIKYNETISLDTCDQYFPIIEKQDGLWPMNDILGY